MSQFFYERKVLCQAHLLHTLNDVIGPIEKILEALEKKVSPKINILSSDFELEISEKCEF